MRYLYTTFLLLLLSFSTWGQSYFTNEELKNWHSLKKEFEQAKYPVTFSEINSGFKPSPDTIFPYAGSLRYMGIDLEDSILQEGKVIGPFRTTINHTSQSIDFIFKILHVDSCYGVRASHILVSKAGSTQREKDNALADKIIQKIKSGSSTFEKMAHQYGNDGTVKNGGDLGWFAEGMMVKPFNDACMNAKKGDLFKVETIFGFHVVTVTENKIKVPFEYIILPIIKFSPTY